MAKKKQTDLIPTAQDIQLLLRIRNSQFTKSTELCDIAMRIGIAKSKPPFYARMEKLIKGGLIEVVEEHAGKYSIHAITKLGLQRLEEQQHHLASLTSHASAPPKREEIPHALKLNEIRNRWESDWGAQQWITALEICAANLDGDGDVFAKDYDAAFRLPRTEWKKQPIRISLEYERTMKAANRYSEIAASLERERSVSFVLYACDSKRMIMTIAEQMRTGRAVFTTAHALLTYGVKSPVFFWEGQNIRLAHIANILAGFP
jgi:hypothetical protein